MTDVGWLQVQVTVDAERVEAAEAALFDCGAASVTFRDAGDAPVHEPDPGTTPMWPQVTAEGLFPADAGRDAITARLVASGVVSSPAALEFRALAERDWERVWMDDYHPMRFGDALWICPSHREPDPDWPLVIRLDPGLAFGSGTHPTTALCLEWIDQALPGNSRVIDYGCGSGVLAIACALKGARDIIAVDHDPQALDASVENARRNEVADRIEVMNPEDFDASGASSRNADVIFANILAGPLIELAPKLATNLAPAGRMVLSGILREQLDDVRQAYENQGLTAHEAELEGWIRLELEVSPHRRERPRSR